MDRLTYRLIGMQKIILNILEVALWRKSIQINYTRKRRNRNEKAIELKGK